MPNGQWEQQFPCSLFDVNGTKNSSDLITEIPQKINANPSTLTPVTTPLNGKYYLLRTEKEIDAEVRKIELYRSDPDKFSFSLESFWEKNIKELVTINFEKAN